MIAAARSAIVGQALRRAAASTRVVSVATLRSNYGHVVRCFVSPTGTQWMPIKTVNVSRSLPSELVAAPLML
jgi:hypothetical protein